MTNAFYNRTFDVTPGVKIGSQRLEDEFAAVERGFDAIPDPDILVAGLGNWATDTGSANTYVLAADPLIVAYSPGLTLRFKAASANTAAAVVNVNALGNKAIRRADNTALQAGDIKLNQVVELTYDGTNFQLIASGAAADSAAAAASALAASGSASAAAGSASAASGSASAAAGSASTASTHATNAGISAAAAAGYVAGLSATSTSSVAIGTGSKSFTTQANKAFFVGQFLLVAGNGAPANWMLGQVTAYNPGSGALTINVLWIGGSGTRTDWNIGLSAPKGDTGSTGAPGVDGMSIVSTQRGEILISAGTTSNTASISSVDTSKTQLRVLGQSSGAGSPLDGDARVVLTNGTTITATRVGNSSDVRVSWELTQFS